VKPSAKRVPGRRALPAAQLPARRPPSVPRAGPSPLVTPPVSHISLGQPPRPPAAPVQRLPRTRLMLHKIYRESKTAGKRLLSAAARGFCDQLLKTFPHRGDTPDPRLDAQGSAPKLSSDTSLTCTATGSKTPASQKSHFRHLSPEKKKFKASFYVFVAAAYGSVELVSGNPALCRSL